MAVAVAPGQRVGEQLQVVAAAQGHGFLKATGEVLPGLLGVQRGRDAVDGLVLGELAAVAGGQRIGVELLQQRGDPLGALLGAAAGRAAGDVLRAVAHVVVERALEPLGLVEVALERVLRGVDDGVEHRVADPLGEQVGVDGAQFGAVGDAEVVQLVVAQRLAHDVQVAGRARGVHMPEHLPGVLPASVHVRLVGGQRRLQLVIVVRGGVDGVRVVDLLVALAFDARARADAARVEADEVVTGAQGLVAAGEAGQRRHARTAGPAEVEEQRTDAGGPLPGLRADQSEIDGGPGRRRVVQRHLERGALPPGAVLEGLRGLARAALRGGGGLAPVPAQPLRAEARTPAGGGWGRDAGLLAPGGPGGLAVTVAAAARRGGEGHHDGRGRQCPGPAPRPDPGSVPCGAPHGLSVSCLPVRQARSLRICEPVSGGCHMTGRARPPGTRSGRHLRPVHERGVPALSA